MEDEEAALGELTDKKKRDYYEFLDREIHLREIDPAKFLSFGSEVWRFVIYIYIDIYINGRCLWEYKCLYAMNSGYFSKTGKLLMQMHLCQKITASNTSSYTEIFCLYIYHVLERASINIPNACLVAF